MQRGEKWVQIGKGGQVRKFRNKVWDGDALDRQIHMVIVGMGRREREREKGSILVKSH